MSCFISDYFPIINIIIATITIRVNVASYTLPLTTAPLHSGEPLHREREGSRLNAQLTIHGVSMPTLYGGRDLEMEENLEGGRIFTELGKESHIQSQSHITTDGQSVCLSWCRSPSGAHDQIWKGKGTRELNQLYGTDVTGNMAEGRPLCGTDVTGKMAEGRPQCGTNVTGKIAERCPQCGTDFTGKMAEGPLQCGTDVTQGHPYFNCRMKWFICNKNNNTKYIHNKKYIQFRHKNPWFVFVRRPMSPTPTFRKHFTFASHEISSNVTENQIKFP
jgi:hypothetical protein